MLILTETTDNIEVVLGAAVTTNQLRCFSCWRDITTTAFTPGRTAINTNSTTDVIVVPSPAASTQRVCDVLNIYNQDTVAQTVTVKFDANGTEYILWSGLLIAGQTLIYQEGNGWSISNGANGYCLFVQALSVGPADTTPTFFGNTPKVPSGTAGIAKVYIPAAGRIVRAEIYCWSGTAGTAEAWSHYVRMNNATDTLIATLSIAASERIFSNSALSIPVVPGDYFEIKSIPPIWATNPLTTIYGGYVYIV